MNEITIGARLKHARLAKNLSLEKLVQRTKLVKSVILQIEADQFDRFPAPLYVMGFIQNLCEEIGVEPGPILEEYKAWLRTRSPGEVPETTVAIQPMDEAPPAEPAVLPALAALRLPGNKVQRLVYLSVIGALALLAVVALIVKIRGRETQTVITTDNEVMKTSTYRMYGEKSSYDLKSGDTVRVFVSDSVKLFTLTAVTSAPEQITFTLDNKSYSLQVEQALQLTTGTSAAPDLEVKLRKISGDLAIVALTVLGYREDKVDYAAIWTNQEHVTVGKETVLFAQQDKFPITVYIRAATQPSHLSYNVDSKRENTATLQTGAATLIRAEETLELQVGNFRSVEIIINKIPVNLATKTDKFSITKIIKWVPDPNNETRYDLVIKDTAN
ncbi:MAG: helix-turn-helix domain-containing protein [Spirochaetes bacterium]|nr:helix-turn-helix domain-containing protein [Spirochaetota bacterium]